jgi:hypothetical protein
MARLVSTVAVAEQVPSSFPRGLTVERSLYAACVVAAAFLRFSNLDGHPLGLREASNAWPAWVTAAGIGPVPPASELSTSALLFSLQWLLFWLGGGVSDAAARWPAAAIGTALVALPWALRPVFGRTSALVLAALLATDPLLVGLSRVADGAIVSAFCALLTFIALARMGPRARASLGASPRVPAWTLPAAAAGLLLVSGSLAWGLMVVLGAAAMAVDRIRESLLGARSAWRASRDRPSLLGLVAVALGTGLVAATAGLAQWEGLPSVSMSLTAWLRAWQSDPGIAGAAAELVRDMVRSQPLLVVMPLLGVVSASTSGGWAQRRRWLLPLLPVAVAGVLAVGQAGALGSRLPLVLALTLTSALASEAFLQRIGGLLRHRTAGAFARGWTVIAAMGLLVLLTVRGAVAAERAAPASPGSRLLAREVAALCAWRPAGPCRIEVVASPWLDPVLAWSLRGFGGVRWVLSPAPAREGVALPLIIAPADTADGLGHGAPHGWTTPYVGSQFSLGVPPRPGGRVVLWFPREQTPPEPRG